MKSKDERWMAARPNYRGEMDIIDETNKIIGTFKNEKDAKEYVRRWNYFMDMENKLNEVEGLLHDGETAEDDGEVVRAVRESEGDYLSMLTDIGGDIRAFLDNMNKN